MRLLKKKNRENIEPPQKRTVHNEEILQLLRMRRIARLRIFAGTVIIIAIICAGFYLFFYKPYQEGIALVTRSEEQVKSGDLSGARKSLAKARLITPYLKSLYYREGLIQLLQMDYNGALTSFDKEISSRGYIGGSELALGFMLTVDSVLNDPEISVENKKAIIEELSNVLDLDIALDSKSISLGLDEKGGLSSAAEHFSQALEANEDFQSATRFGLAYINALRGDREAGAKSYGVISSNRDLFPLLAKFYGGTETRLGFSSSAPKSTEEKSSEETSADNGMVGPDLPIQELPPTPDGVPPQEPPDIGMPSSTKLPPIHNLKAFTKDPTVKPFKLKQYPGKDGKMKYIVTLLNIKDSGKSVAREGQHREMPNTRVDVLVMKLTEDEIVLKEDNLYTFTWKRGDRASWNLVDNEESKKG